MNTLDNVTTDPQKEKSPNKVHPQKFAMWIALGSIILMFAGFTSGYLVRRGQGMWEKFDIPTIFGISTVIIILSSLTLHFAVKAFRRDETGKYNSLMIATIVLGTAFMVLQYLGFMQLYGNNVRVNGNVSNSFFFVIAGAHLLHILGGIIAVLIVYLKTKLQTKKNVVGLEIVSTYWHFVDILWIYLYVFLLIYR